MGEARTRQCERRRREGTIPGRRRRRGRRHQVGVRRGGGRGGESLEKEDTPSRFSVRAKLHTAHTVHSLFLSFMSTRGCKTGPAKWAPVPKCIVAIYPNNSWRPKPSKSASLGIFYFLFSSFFLLFRTKIYDLHIFLRN